MGGNIVVDPSLGLVGILDWEGACLGHRYSDISWICTPSWRFGNWDLPVGGFASMEPFLEEYEAVSGLHIDRQALDWWILYSQIRWAALCVMMGKRSTENRKLLEYSVIGRRTSEAEI